MVKMLPAFQDKFTAACGYHGRDSELQLSYGPSRSPVQLPPSIGLTADPDFGIDISSRAGNQELIKALREPLGESRRDTCLRFISSAASKLKADVAKDLQLVEDGRGKCHACQLPIGRGQPGGLINICFGEPPKRNVVTTAYFMST